MGEIISDEGLRQGVTAAVGEKADDSYRGLYPEIATLEKSESDQEEKPAMTPEQVQAKIDSIRLDPNHIYNKPSPIHRLNVAAQTEMENLYKLAFPEGDRQSVPETDRGIFDRLKSLGLDTDQITRIGEEGREEITEREAIKVMNTADYELKGRWANDYEENLSIVHYFDENVVNKADQENLRDAIGNDPVALDAIAILGRKLIDAGIWPKEALTFKRPVRKETK